jgi:hypothetical protein
VTAALTLKLYAGLSASATLRAVAAFSIPRAWGTGVTPSLFDPASATLRAVAAVSIPRSSGGPESTPVTPGSHGDQANLAGAMAPALRTEVADALHHVTSRGNERRPIFRNDHDRRTFLLYVGEAATRSVGLLALTLAVSGPDGLCSLHKERSATATDALLKNYADSVKTACNSAKHRTLQV